MNFDFDVESLSPNASTVITLSSTGAVQLPAGTTAQQPTATAGRLRWNSDNTRLEYSNGSIWQNVQFSSTTLAGYGITDAQPLNTNLTAYAALATTGLVIRTGAGTVVTRSIAGTAGNVTVSNGDGVAGNPTINLATVGTAGTYATVTTDAFGRVASGVATQPVATGGTGLTALGTANQVLGVNAGASALEYKTLTAGTNISIVHAANSVTINATAGGPGGANTNVQFNNSGAFGGSNSFNFVNGADPYVSVVGTTATNQLRVGPAYTASGLAAKYVAGPATVYIETNNTNQDGQLVYFNSGVAATGGYISYAYDGNTPYIRITDADDDPPYLTFNTIGTGTYASSLYVSTFGARGTPGSRTGGNNAGFAWHIGVNTTGNALYAAGTPVMELDTTWLRIPSGTTANRPTGAVGMVRYNTTDGGSEGFDAGNWKSFTGTINKSFTPLTYTTVANTNFISFTVPGGTLGTNQRALRIRAAGTFTSNGAGRTLDFFMAYGGTTMWSDTSATMGAGTYGWHIDVVLSPANSATAQHITGMVHIGGNGASDNGDTGNMASDEITSVAVVHGTAAVNSANPLTLAFSTTVAGGTMSFSKFFHTVELL